MNSPEFPKAFSTQILKQTRDQGFNLSTFFAVSDLDSSIPNPANRWGTYFPGVQGGLLLASGGAGHFEHIQKNEFKKTEGKKNPIDHFTKEFTEQLIDFFPKESVIGSFFPFGFEKRPLSLPRLGEHAGLGTAQTVLGYLIHPQFGPWVSLRGVLLMNQKPGKQFLNIQPHQKGFNPCMNCFAPCALACPGGAFQTEFLGSKNPWEFNLTACSRQILHSNSCEERCHSRGACLFGLESAYSPQEEKHRQGAMVETVKNFSKSTQKNSTRPLNV